MTLVRRLRMAATYGTPTNPAGVILNRLGEAIVPTNTEWRRSAGGPWQKKSTAGTVISEDNVMELDSVLACVRVLAESVASLPFELFEVNDETDELTVAKDHRLYDLLRWAPNPETTAYELRFEMVVDAIVRGYGAAQIVRTNKGEVMELWPLEAAYLRAYRAPDGRLVYCYTLRKSGGKQEKVLLEANEVLLIKCFSRGGLLGSSLTRMAVNLFGATKAAEEFAAEFFENGSIHTGMIEVPEELSDIAYARLKKDWKEQHTGKGNRHRAPILEGGAKFNAMSLTNQEAQLLETVKFKRSQVAGIMRVPAHLINDLEKATYSNIEHTDLGFVKHSLRPWCTNIEQRCQLTLLNAGERRRYVFSHDLTDMSRGDFPTRMEGYSKAIASGIMSPNEARRKEKLNPYPDGDKYFVQGALRPTDEPYKAAAAPAAGEPGKLDKEAKALLASFARGLKLLS